MRMIEPPTLADDTTRAWLAEESARSWPAWKMCSSRAMKYSNLIRSASTRRFPSSVTALAPVARSPAGGEALQGAGLPLEFGPGLIPGLQEPRVADDDEPALGGLDVDGQALQAVRGDQHLQRVVRAGLRIEQGVDRQGQQEEGGADDGREQRAHRGGAPGKAGTSTPVTRPRSLHAPMFMSLTSRNLPVRLANDTRSHWMVTKPSGRNAQKHRLGRR